MITIIHGDDTVSSRNFLFEIKKDSDNQFTFNAKTLNLTDLTQALKGTQLFEENKNIFIEDLLTGKKTSTENERIIEFIKKNHNSFNIYLWESNKLGKILLNLLPDAKIKLFKLPQNLFYFLDNIKSNNINNVANFHKALVNMDAEAIFYMMIRQFRLLIVLRSEIPLRGTPNSEIDEIKRLAPWQKEKLKKQACYFDFNALKKIYAKLFKIDLEIKTGSITNLSRAIDILLLEI